MIAGGGSMDPPPDRPGRWLDRRMDLDELEWLDDEDDELRLATPSVDEILELAETDTLNNSARTAVLKARRKAADPPCRYDSSR